MWKSARYKKLTLRVIVGWVAVLVFSVVALAVLVSSGAGPADRGSAGGSADRKTQWAQAAGKKTYDTYCSPCHNASSEEFKIGPGLKGLFKRKRMVHKEAPVTKETVQRLVQEGSTTDRIAMPAFKGVLNQEQMNELLSYLQTL